MNLNQLIEDSRPFLGYILDWKENLPVFDLDQALGGRGDRAAVMAVDVTQGFCFAGPLSSPRVAAIVDPVVALFERGHGLGIREFVLIQDTHHPQAIEFSSYPAHCVAGSQESMTVPQLVSLPFSDGFVTMPKNSVDVTHDTQLIPWLDAHPHLDTFLVVGDCTDICTYNLAMHLRLRHNAFNKPVRVILPENCVQTYDLPVDTAREIGGVPHHGDLLHLIFLYHMMLNGVEVVAGVK